MDRDPPVDPYASSLFSELGTVRRSQATRREVREEEEYDGCGLRMPVLNPCTKASPVDDGRRAVADSGVAARAGGSIDFAW